MKFSRNPASGVVEAYTDDGVYLGRINTMGDTFEDDQREETNDNADALLDGGPGSGNFGHPGYPRGGHSAQASKAHVQKMNKEREEWSNLSLRQKIKGNSEQQKHMAKVKMAAAKAALQGNKKKAGAIKAANAHYWGNDPESAMKIQSETLARQKRVK